MATMYRICAIDCDGPGVINYAPYFDTEEEAQEWIDNFDGEGSDITRIWFEEFQGKEYCEPCDYEYNAEYIHHMCPPEEGDN